jgi:tetratricopeptide (TPR) repeat protein
VLGDRTGALELQRDALAIELAAVGPDHDNISAARNNLGGTLLALARYEEALVEFREAARIQEATHGPTHFELVLIHGNIGNVLQQMRDLDGADAAYQKALAVADAQPTPPPDAAQMRMNLAMLRGRQGKKDEARTLFAEARAALVELYGEKHLWVGICDVNEGVVLSELREFGAAIALFERAITILEPILGEAVEMAQPYLGIGNAYVEAGEPERALPYLARADELRALVPGDLVLAGQVHIMRGRALYDSGVDREGGIAMVRAGRDEYARSPLAQPGDLDATDAWLRDKR